MAVARLDDVFVDLFFVFLLAMLAMLAVTTVRDDVIDQNLQQISFIQDQTHLIAVVQGNVLAGTGRTTINGPMPFEEVTDCLREEAFPEIESEEWNSFQKRTGLVVKEWEASGRKPISARYDMTFAEAPIHLIFEMCCETPTSDNPYPHPVQFQMVDSDAVPVLQDLSFAFDSGADPAVTCKPDSLTRLVPLTPLDDSRVRLWHLPACKVAVVTLEQ